MKKGKRLGIVCGLLFMMMFMVNPQAARAATASSYYAAVNSKATGGLAVNDKPAPSSKGQSKELTAIPIGAVCTVYPAKSSGNWYWVTYNGVSGYAYGTYLYEVTRTVESAMETAHPHRGYRMYSNGYKEYTGITFDSYYYLADTKATCTTKGYRTRKCGQCGYEWNVDYTPATGHSYNSGVVTKAATTTSTGTKTYTCKTCGAKKTETIPKIASSSSSSSSSNSSGSSSSTGTVGNGSSTTIGSSSSSTNKKITVTSLVKGKNFTLSLSEINYTYTGKALKPKVTVKYKNKKVNSKYYTVKYSANKNPGIATITVTGTGSYKSKIPATKMYFQIIPKKMSTPTVTAGKGSFTVNWKTHTGVSGYEVMIARNSKFTSSKQMATLKSASYKKLYFSSMKRNTKYYIKIRAYKINSDGTRVAGKWSSTKTVKTK